MPFQIKSWSMLVVVCLAVRAAHAQHAPSSCDDGHCIQVGSYNIELLGSNRKPYGGVDRGERTDAQLDDLAERIATTLDLEIVVFQEINTASNEWSKLRGKLAGKGYHFFEGTTSDRNQFVILAWDSDEVTLLDNSAKELDVSDAFDLGNGCKEDGLRKPVAGHFQSGDFDFWVIGVHLKSRTGTSSCTSKIRAAQCDELVAKIDDLTGDSSESDVIIVGDCNELRDHVSLKPLRDAGFISQMKFLMPDSASGSYVKTGSLHESDDLIDHVWLRYSDTMEVVR